MLPGSINATYSVLKPVFIQKSYLVWQDFYSCNTPLWQYTQPICKNVMPTSRPNFSLILQVGYVKLYIGYLSAYFANYFVQKRNVSQLPVGTYCTVPGTQVCRYVSYRTVPTCTFLPTQLYVGTVPVNKIIPKGTGTVGTQHMYYSVDIRKNLVVISMEREMAICVSCSGREKNGYRSSPCVPVLPYIPYATKSMQNNFQDPIRRALGGRIFAQ